ncbi:MAG: hypothetical protein HUU15_06880 [Candidatus Brocadiae bacterium]|nr:hypothetical protein [Candidatus Brocadiia bacterium]
MVLSAVNMDPMVDFYRNVFDMQFEVEEDSGQKMYTGTFSGLAFTLIPAGMNGITAPQNPTHYDIYVPDINAVIALVEKHGGRTNGRLGESDTERAIGVFDPDGNFMVFKQRK